MAFYKRIRKKSSGLWYPQIITLGRPAGTDEVARRLSELSTVSRADVYAVLGNLPEVLSTIMAEGRSVRLDGLGTFYYTADTRGAGVATEEEVSPDQIRAVRVRFIPGYSRAGNNKVTRRSLASAPIDWVDCGTVTNED